MSVAIDWASANQRYLTDHVSRIRALLRRHSGADGDTELSAPSPQTTPLFALDRVCRAFDLSPFERDALVLCAACELDSQVVDLVGAIMGRGAGVPRYDARPTFGLALAALPEPHWSALAPSAPLRGWKLIELEGTSPAHAPLRIDERILHFIAGVDCIDERVRAFVERVEPRAVGELDGRIAQNIADDYSARRSVQVTGTDSSRCRAVATAACALLGSHALLLQADDIPPIAADRTVLAMLLARETALSGSIHIVDAFDTTDLRVRRLLDVLHTPAIVLARDPLALGGDASVIELPARTRQQRRAAWRAALGTDADRVNGIVDLVASQFELDDATIAGIAAHARVKSATADAVAGSMWDASRRAARPRMEGLAQRIEPLASWNDLVLPRAQADVLHSIASHVRHRARVYDEWGFATKSTRGLGITALFAGPPGTGKTMAAEVLARELRVDLYRVDLAGVVSKYIGETEKNLRAVFDAAEGSGAILLFDEADALFGKRSEVKDSHDRYANVEISYLLQRMEAYRGLAILTTNMKQALDPAFARRLRFVVNFPFPDAAQRSRIWRGVFPSGTPAEALDYTRLAQLNVTGGHIRNIALGAAFRAAEGGQAVTMGHVAEAARAEYAKLERPLTDGELRGWVS